MATIVFDIAVMQAAAAETGMTTDQLKAWYAANYQAIKDVRLYIQSRGSTEDTYIEQYADPNGPLDPTLVQQILALLRNGGLIDTLETT